MNELIASVAYRCLALVFITMPPFIDGLWLAARYIS